MAKFSEIYREWDKNRESNDSLGETTLRSVMTETVVKAAGDFLDLVDRMGVAYRDYDLLPFYDRLLSDKDPKVIESTVWSKRFGSGGTILTMALHNKSYEELYLAYGRAFGDLIRYDATGNYINLFTYTRNMNDRTIIRAMQLATIARNNKVEIRLADLVNWYTESIVDRKLPCAELGFILKHDLNVGKFITIFSALKFFSPEYKLPNIGEPFAKSDADALERLYLKHLKMVACTPKYRNVTVWEDGTSIVNDTEDLLFFAKYFGLCKAEYDRSTEENNEMYVTIKDGMPTSYILKHISDSEEPSTFELIGRFGNIEDVEELEDLHDIQSI